MSLADSITELEALDRECETAYKEVEELLEYTSHQAIELERSQRGFGHYCGVMSRFGYTFEDESGMRSAFLVRLTRERIALLRFLRDELIAGRVK